MRIMRLKDVIDTTGLARSTIYKYIGVNRPGFRGGFNS